MHKAGKISAVVVLLIVLTIPSSAQITFRFYGGMAHASTGDLVASAEASNEILDLLSPDHTGVFKKLCCGTDFGGEFVFALTPHFGVGIGFELLQLRSKSTLVYNLGVPTNQTVTHRMEVYPITLNVHAVFPITSYLNLDVSAGTGYYRMNFDVEENLLWNTGNPGASDQSYTFQSHRETLGLQARWGMDIYVTQKISFFVGGAGRWANYSSIRGDWILRGQTPELGSYSDVGSNHYMWFYEESIQGKNYPQVVYSEASPEDVFNSRKGHIHLTGFSFSVGIVVKLGAINK